MKKFILNYRLLKFAGFALLVLFICFVISWYVGMSKTTWGGWTPPDVSLKLTPKEQKWKKNVEFKYNCVVDYIGLDSGYMEDSIIYLTLIYRENSTLKTELNTKIEEIGSSIAKSFKVLNKRKQQYFKIRFSYYHNYSKDIVTYNIPSDRILTFDFKNNRILSLQKILIVSKFMYYDYVNGRIMRNRIGGQMYEYINNQYNKDSLNINYEIQNLINYKGIDSCTKFISKNPKSIVFQNGKIEVFYQYILHKNLCLSSKITYKYFPSNKTFKYKDFFNNVTPTPPKNSTNDKKEQFNLLDSLKQNDYSYKNIIYGVLVNFKGDTTKIPWTINYETSQFDLNFFYTESQK